MCDPRFHLVFGEPFPIVNLRIGLLLFLFDGVHIFVLILVHFRLFSGNSVLVFPVTKFGYQFEFYRNFFALITDIFAEVKYCGIILAPRASIIY